jgi:hypothetical protein
LPRGALATGVAPEAVVDALVADCRGEFAGGAMPLQAMVFAATKKG